MKFNSFNLTIDVLEAVNKLGYLAPTEVQSKVIPKALRYENLIVQSSTGSGKTHSFLIPIFNNLNLDKGLEVVIVSPTRELCKQTYDFAIQFNNYLDNKFIIKLFISGTDTLKDYESFQNGANMIICTPGKLNDLFDCYSHLFNQVKTVVFDEADMLFDKSFTEEMSKFVSNFNEVQILLFSATLSKNIQNFFKKFIKESELIEIDSKNFTNINVKHHLINDKHKDLNKLTKDLIEIINPFFMLIFVNTKEEANSLYQYLSKNKIECGLLTGDLEARERKSVLKRINNLEYKVVVCTDIASRGLDIEGASDVLNINLPNNIEYYYHRAGRCGRGKYDGNSYIFYNHEDLPKINKLIENGLQVDYLKLENGKILADLPLKVEKSKGTKKKKQILDEETYLNYSKEKAIVIAKNKGSKVKPGYKKKIKKEINKINKKIHREELKKERIKHMSKDLIIGSHLSLSSPNYFLNTVKEAIDYNETTFMFYTGAPQNSIRTPLDKLKIDEGFKLLEGTNIDIKNVVVHAPYIINLASAKDFVAKKSIETLNNELNRTSAFKVPNIVLHPGSHADWTLENGMQQIIKYLNSVFEMNKTDVVVCLETMAGHKNEIGKTFEEIAYIIKHIKDKSRIGVCLDTCHINDAGYDISDVDGVLDDFDKIIGLKYLRVIHLNDSKNARGSHKDRHENIGYGTLGFKNILKRAYSERLAHLPKILETPYFEGKSPYKTEIEIIRKKAFFDFKNLANLDLFFQ